MQALKPLWQLSFNASVRAPKRRHRNSVNAIYTLTAETFGINNIILLLGAEKVKFYIDFACLGYL
jgi:hypothetical protein